MEHLEIKEGYKYTQVSDVEISERVIAEQLYIPDGQSELWKSITDEEAATYEAEKEKALKEQEGLHSEISTATVDTETTVDRTIEIDCPHCGKKIYYTPPTDSTDVSEIGSFDDELL